MSGLSKKWEAKNEPSVGAKVKEAIRPPGPLKPRLDNAMRRIDVQVQKLDQTSNRFADRDKTIFGRLVDSYEKHDMTRAHVYANELAEIRKMEKMTLQAKMALEQISLRLTTVTELGDIAVTLAPVIGVVTNVTRMIGAVSPEAAKELGEIGDLLNGIALDAGAIGSMSLNFDNLSEDSEKILSEAASVAEQRMKTKFPDLSSIEEKTDEKLPP